MMFVVVMYGGMRVCVLRVYLLFVVWYIFYLHVGVGVGVGVVVWTCLSLCVALLIH